MAYQFLQNHLFTLPILLAVVGEPLLVHARPAAVFVPHLAEIQRSLPIGLAMRLPTDILLSVPLDIDPNQLIVRVFPSETPSVLTVSLFTCETGPQPCLVGSFSVERKTSPHAMRELAKHQAKGDRITLKKPILGYLIEGPQQNPPYEFSSVMWEQDGMIYSAVFPAVERQSLLLMAYSMANNTPIRRSVPRPSVFR